MKFCLIFFTFVFSICALNAQEVSPDSLSPIMTLTDQDSVRQFDLPVDTTNSVATNKKKKGLFKGYFKKDYPNPKRAMLMSFIVPGSGQIYNKKYWKAPIAIGGTISMIFVVRNNTVNYRILRDEYRARLDPESGLEPDPRFALLEDDDIQQARDRWNKWKEMSYIGLVLVQALGGVDAFVDAHLYGLEINEDLSLIVEPSFESDPAFGTSVGLGLKLQFNAPIPPQPKPFYGVGR